MKFDAKVIAKLKELMIISRKMGNLANSGVVLENGIPLAFSESLVVTNHDATAHSERLLVSQICKRKSTHYTPGLTMVTVIEPCLMCLSACAQAGYKEVAYIIPAARYIKPIPWISDTANFDKHSLTKYFSESIQLVHLKEYEEEFCKVFEEAMKKHLTPN